MTMAEAIPQALIVFGLYLLPTIIAVARRKELEEGNTIIALNILLGWTGVVWIVTLWAATGWDGKS